MTMTEMHDDLHDLEDELRTYRPAVTEPTRHRAWPPRGELHYDIGEFEEIGRMLVATRPDGTVLNTVYLERTAEERTIDRLARVVSPAMVRGGSAPARVLRQLEEYVAGHRTGFELEYDLALTNDFQRSVLLQLDTVGYGRTTTYGALAKASGHPRAARAVGSALGANPLCVVLPCHRVLAGSGRLSGYAGGAEAKRFLLDLEEQNADDGPKAERGKRD